MLAQEEQKSGNRLPTYTRMTLDINTGIICLSVVYKYGKPS